MLVRLQWGRILKDAEMGDLAIRKSGEAQASMGPHLERCGNLTILNQFSKARFASMGPHLERCGNQSVMTVLQG